LAENTDFTVNGDFYVGDAFSGNTVTTTATGNTVDATMEVNPGVLKEFGDANGKPGEGMLHAVTEGYEGALISQASGKSSPKAGQPGSVYPQAHANATKQPGIITAT